MACCQQEYMHLSIAMCKFCCTQCMLTESARCTALLACILQTLGWRKLISGALMQCPVPQHHDNYSKEAVPCHSGRHIVLHLSELSIIHKKMTLEALMHHWLYVGLFLDYSCMRSKRLSICYEPSPSGIPGLIVLPFLENAAVHPVSLTARLPENSATTAQRLSHGSAITQNTS